MKKKKKENLDIKSNKKHIFRKILLGLLVIVLLIFIISMINNFITNRKIDKFRDNISSIEKEKINYVFIEINPSLVLIMKDGKVSDVACLNNDCIDIYSDIDVKGKSIDESIDNLYNLSKEKGYDTSNGVKIKTTNEIDIKNKDYISVEYINNDTKNELLSNVKNNEEIKDINNDDYHTTFWEELRKDEDYGKIYECNMNYEQLECYIKKDIFPTNTEFNLETLKYVVLTQKDIIRVLDKFSIKYEIDSVKLGVVEDLKIYINDIEFNCGMGLVCTPSPYRLSELENYSIWGDLYLYKSSTGLNLLNPIDSLNSLIYEVETQGYNDIVFNEKPYIIKEKKECDINLNNCKNHQYSYCDLSDIKENTTYSENDYTCQTIDSGKYQYYTNRLKMQGGLGCYTLDEFGLSGQSVCKGYEHYENDYDHTITTGFYRCYGEINSKNCSIISLTNEEYEMFNSIRPNCKLNSDTLKFNCE